MDTYSWDTKRCIRYGENFTGEEHPCYWCGLPLTDMLNLSFCSKCGGVHCPHCGGCWCNVSKEKFDALKKLRNKYCCTRYHFMRGIEDKDKQLLDLVPGFSKALDYCRRWKGVII